MNAAVSPSFLRALAVLAPGLVVSLALSPWGHPLFLPNFAFFWISQLLVVLVAFVLRARAAALIGVAMALALFLAGFGAWVNSRVRPDATAWVGYLFSLPGAAIAAAAIAIASRRLPARAPWFLAIESTTVVCTGAFINLWIICMNWMYCCGR